MATMSTRHLCSCSGRALVSSLSSKACYCHSAASATRPVRLRSQSCKPSPPASSASLQVALLDRRLSTTGSGSGQSKSSLKDWLQYLSRISPNVDASSLSRVLTSLHVDLPRNLPEVRRLLPNISLSEFQQTVAKNRFTRGKVPTSANDLENKKLPDTVAKSDTEQSPSADVQKTSVHDSGQLQCDKPPVAHSVISTSLTSDNSEERKTRDMAVQQHVVSESTAEVASGTVASASSVPVTDSVRSKLNTVASGIAKQIADYMPTVDTSTATRTKPQQKPESRSADVKEKTKPTGAKKDAAAVQKQTMAQRQLVTRGSIDRHTRGLVLCLRDARTSTSRLVRIEELCQHIAKYPDCTGLAIKVCSFALMYFLLRFPLDGYLSLAMSAFDVF